MNAFQSLGQPSVMTSKQAMAEAERAMRHRRSAGYLKPKFSGMAFDQQPGSTAAKRAAMAKARI